MKWEPMKKIIIVCLCVSALGAWINNQLLISTFQEMTEAGRSGITSVQMVDDTLVEQGTYYLIQKEEDYKYTFFDYEGNVLAEGVMVEYASVTEVRTGVLRLQSRDESSVLVQYFDVGGRRISDVFKPDSVYAERFDEEERIAYIKGSADGYAVLTIEPIFDKSEDSYTIQRNFVSSATGVKEIKFLNENEIYMEYEEVNGATPSQHMSEDLGVTVLVKEIVNYRENNGVYKEYRQK